MAGLLDEIINEQRSILDDDARNDKLQEINKYILENVLTPFMGLQYNEVALARANGPDTSSSCGAGGPCWHMVSKTSSGVVAQRVLPLVEDLEQRGVVVLLERHFDADLRQILATIGRSSAAHDPALADRKVRRLGI